MRQGGAAVRHGFDHDAGGIQRAIGVRIVAENLDGHRSIFRRGCRVVCCRGRLVDGVDRHGQGRARLCRTVADRVVNRVGAGESCRRAVVQRGAASADADAATVCSRSRGTDDGQGVAIGIAVIIQHRNAGQRRVLVGGGTVIVGHGRCIAGTGDVGRHGRGVAASVAIDDGVGELLCANEILGRGVVDAAGRGDGRRAARGRGAQAFDDQRIAIGIAVIGEHIDVDPGAAGFDIDGIVCGHRVVVARLEFAAECFRIDLDQRGIWEGVEIVVSEAANRVVEIKAGGQGRAGLADDDGRLAIFQAV